jgi:hypothetical protein
MAGILWLVLTVVMRRRRHSRATYARGVALAAAQYCLHSQRQFEAVLICLCWDHGGVEEIPNEKLEDLRRLLISPKELKQVLTADSYKTIYENAYHWYLAREEKDVPIIIPKQPWEDGCVSLKIMANTLFKAQISYHKYVEIRMKLGAEKAATGIPPPRSKK